MPDDLLGPLDPEAYRLLQQRAIRALNERRKRRKQYRVPTQRFPRGAQLQYTKGLLQMQWVVEGEVRTIIYPELPAIPSLHPDHIVRKVEEVRIAVGERIDLNVINNLTAQVGEQLNLFNMREVGRQLESVLGIDLITAEPWLEQHMATFQRENVNLVKSLFGTELDDLENILLRSNRAGLRVEEIRKQIQNRFGVSKSKAELIARDQVGKLNGEITQLRQEGIGVTHYVWRCSLDERVRGNPGGKYPKATPSHWGRHGTRYNWKHPPEGGHPGQPVQCRCTAEPDLTPFLWPDRGA